MQALERLERGPVLLLENSLGHMNLEIRIDANQMRIERRMVSLGKWNPVRNNWLSKFLVLIRNDMCGIEQD